MIIDANDDIQDIRMTSDDVIIPGTDMSVYEALYRRRMAWQFEDDPVPREAVDRMLEAAVWAPNHRLTEPWRFFVLEKESELRQKVANLAYESSIERTNNTSLAEAARKVISDPPILNQSQGETRSRIG